MNLLSRRDSCPYCGEPIELLVDESELGQQYIEDCQVCCRPMVVNISIDPDGEATTRLSREDE
jgi:hypothetical protein